MMDKARSKPNLTDSNVHNLKTCSKICKTKCSNKTRSETFALCYQLRNLSILKHPNFFINFEQVSKKNLLFL